MRFSIALTFVAVTSVLAAAIPPMVAGAQVLVAETAATENKILTGTTVGGMPAVLSAGAAAGSIIKRQAAPATGVSPVDQVVAIGEVVVAEEKARLINKSE